MNILNCMHQQSLTAEAPTSSSPQRQTHTNYQTCVNQEIEMLIKKEETFYVSVCIVLQNT